MTGLCLQPILRGWTWPPMQDACAARQQNFLQAITVCQETDSLVSILRTLHRNRTYNFLDSSIDSSCCERKAKRAAGSPTRMRLLFSNGLRFLLSKPGAWNNSQKTQCHQPLHLTILEMQEMVVSSSLTDRVRLVSMGQQKNPSRMLLSRREVLPSRVPQFSLRS